MSALHIRSVLARLRCRYRRGIEACRVVMKDVIWYGISPYSRGFSGSKGYLKAKPSKS